MALDLQAEAVWVEGGHVRGDLDHALVDHLLDGLPARDAYMLGQVVRYADRAGRKDDPAVDLGKANNYAHRLVCGRWRDRG